MLFLKIRLKITDIGRQKNEGISKGVSGWCNNKTARVAVFILDKVDTKAKSIKWYDFILMRKDIHKKDNPDDSEPDNILSKYINHSCHCHVMSKLQGGTSPEKRPMATPWAPPAAWSAQSSQPELVLLQMAVLNLDSFMISPLPVPQTRLEDT